MANPAWQKGMASPNPTGRPKMSVTVTKAQKALERGSKARVEDLEWAITQARANDDYKSVIAGCSVWLKKTNPDALPFAAGDNAPPEKQPTPEEVAAAVERLQLLREHEQHH